MVFSSVLGLHHDLYLAIYFAFVIALLTTYLRRNEIVSTSGTAARSEFRRKNTRTAHVGGPNAAGLWAPFG